MLRCLPSARLLARAQPSLASSKGFATLARPSCAPKSQGDAPLSDLPVKIPFPSAEAIASAKVISPQDSPSASDAGAFTSPHVWKRQLQRTQLLRNGVESASRFYLYSPTVSSTLAGQLASAPAETTVSSSIAAAGLQDLQLLPSVNTLKGRVPKSEKYDSTQTQRGTLVHSEMEAAILERIGRPEKRLLDMPALADRDSFKHLGLDYRFTKEVPRAVDGTLVPGVKKPAASAAAASSKKGAGIFGQLVDAATTQREKNNTMSIGPFSRKLADIIVDKVGSRISDVSCVETAVVHSTLGYAGTIDCVAKFDGVWSVVDWKTTDSEELTVSLVQSHQMLVAAYMAAFNHDKLYREHLKHPPLLQGVLVFGKTSENIEVIVYKLDQAEQMFNAFKNSIRDFPDKLKSHSEPAKPKRRPDPHDSPFAGPDK